jgi:hypothetical protein
MEQRVASAICEKFRHRGQHSAALLVLNSRRVSFMKWRTAFNMPPFRMPVRANRTGVSDASGKIAGHVFLFRGLAGLVFSRGMDQLNDRFSQVGITSSVNSFLICSTIAETAIRIYRRDPSPITIIGHSAGGSCALRFAELLRAASIPVSLLVTIDPTRLDKIFDYKLPLNVERYINIYQPNNILGGRDVVPEQGFLGRYASFNLSDHEEIHHINIDKLESVHEQLVTKVKQLPFTPRNDQGEDVPIRCNVPADTSIELWDTGRAVFAEAGETLERLAETYKVPVWSLAQINQLPSGVPLDKDQRLVVPRHLIPLASPRRGEELRN